jgi:hypothetical protein
MQKKFYALLALLVFTTTAAFSQSSGGTLKGKVFDKDTKEPLPFVTVIVFLNGNTVNGGTTDIDGEYSIKPLEAGTYDVSFQFVGYQPQTTKGVVIHGGGKLTQLNAEMLAGVELTTVEVFDYKVPLIDKDGGSSGGTITREDLKNMPSRSVSGLATTVAGATGTDNGISIRGAREGSTWIYIDGIKVRGSSALPKSAIEEVNVITGGIPANIGDATGGVINVSLRNASAKYTGGFEAISSGFASGNKAVGLDHFGYNLIEGSLSGPLVFKKDENGEKVRPLLGFFVSGNYTDVVDGDPQFGGMNKIKKSSVQGILDNPIRPNVDASGNITGVLYNANYLTASDFEKTPTRLNVRNRSANLVAKIDVNTSENITLTFGGTGAFTRGHDFSYSNSLMNSENNQLSTNLDWRAYARFTQRFKNAEGEDASSSNLKNVYYSVMVDFSRNFQKNQDETHGSDLFKYGHIGYFDIIRGNTYEQIPGSYFKQTGFQDLQILYKPSEFNPDLSAIDVDYFYGASFFPSYQLANNYIQDASGNIIRDREQIFLNDTQQNTFLASNPAANINNITGGGGLRNGDSPPGVYGLYSYVGSQNNNYATFSNNQFRVSGSGSADIGDHSVSIGFEYEQRKDAGFAVAPIGFWDLARQYTNFHIGKLDNQPNLDGIIEYDSTIVKRGDDYYVYYNTLVADSSQAEFDYNLRTALGLDPRGGEYLNIDNISPEFLSIDMFNADELLNSGFTDYITYYGYDHHGKKLRGKKPTIEDFFSKTYKVGEVSYFSRPIGAYEPIYTSGYIMDKFAFDDLIFSVGVRVDRYDANQPVLKDPFVVSEAFTAGEVSNIAGKAVSHPSNIGSDYVVYVDNVNDPTSISGYRNGNEWYNAIGQLVTDPNDIAGSGDPKPYLKVDKFAPLTANAFKDYKPVVNVMPRIAFSFPISDEATFFAHYDVLTQRPTEFARFNPADYLNMGFQSNPLIANPALKPERTVDYALGFQQVLSKTSSLKIEAFYRELRNMIQIRKFSGAYPQAYRAFDNIDFGTVKGLTMTYDLRRTGNLRMNASYTLQFADGTGSTSQSQTALINAGLPNLRSINPFNYDQRHRIIVTGDYRFGGGSDYNGPLLGDFQVLGNTGFNLIGNLGSGTPYTPQKLATPVTGEISPSTEGSINGARLPWQFTVDFNVDRNFNLTFGADGDKKKTANLNVYIWVTNLLNTRNVRSVYRFTGIPNDDGYLASATAQQNINSQINPDSFRNYYSMYVNNPNNYGQPRQIRLGVRFDF